MRGLARILLALTLLGRASAETITVDPAGGGDFTEIQAALDAAADGDIVLVAEGEHVLEAPLDFNRLHDVLDPTSPPRKDLVVRSAGGPQTTILRMSGAPLEASRASVVVFEKGETRRTILEGFTLTSGRGSEVQGFGIAMAGGILCRGSSPALVDLRIVENFSGGLYLEGASPLLEGCAIEDNHGGGVTCLAGSSPVFSVCRIAGNGSGSEGGGIYASDSTLALERTEISGNRSCRDCAGGGIEVGDTTLTMTACIIAGNEGSGGGGLSIYGGSNVDLVNCLFAGNRSAQRGGGVQVKNEARLRMTHCTFAGNSSRYDLGSSLACFDEAFPPVITSCILTSDEPLGLCGNVEGSLVDEDPHFVRPGAFDFERTRRVELDGGYAFGVPDFILDAGDYRLSAESPAIDAGILAGAPGFDLAGAPRPCGSGVDIGAYERCDGEPQPAPFRRADASPDGAIDITDAVFILSFAFLGGSAPACLKSLDVDDGGEVDLTDAVYLLGYLFLGGSAPPPPFPECGLDPSADALDCELHERC